MMFAVIKTGGKQYRVAAGDRLKVEKLAGETGDIVELNEVLMVGDKIGAPLVDGACVAAEIVEQGRARKVIAFKKRRRQNSRRTIGHRQHFSMIEVTEILTDGKKPSKKAAAKKPVAKADEKPKAEKKTEPKAEAKTEKKEAAPKPDKKAEAPKTEKKAEAPAAGAPLFSDPKGEKDKLTDIKGIGPVAETQLNEQGIMTFAQIAALSKDDIARIDEYMPFSADQITDWQKQAKELTKG